MGFDFEQEVRDGIFQLQAAAVFAYLDLNTSELGVQAGLTAAKRCTSFSKVVADGLGAIAARLFPENAETAVFMAPFGSINDYDVRPETAFAVHGQAAPTPFAVDFH